MQMQIIIDRILRGEKINMLKIHHKMVIYMISSFMGKRTYCWPSHKELARCCGISISTLIRTLKTLEKMKIIFIERKSNNNNIYTFNEMWIKNSDSIKQLLTKRRVSVTPHSVSVTLPSVRVTPEYTYNNNINNKTLSLVEKQSTSHVKEGRENGEVSPLLKSYWEDRNRY